MIGTAHSQISILDGALNNCKKRCRTDKLLKKINEFVNWNNLVDICKVVYKDSKRGRPSTPIEFSIKSLFLQYLYNLSDPALEDALIDRFSFQKFLGISFDTEIPDFSTIWRFRERLIIANIFDELFKVILSDLEERGLLLRRGTLIDATIVQGARKPHTKDNNEKGEQSPRSKSQRDSDANFTKKGKKTFHGYKGHIGVDEGSGIIRKKAYTPASVHDSQKTDELISGDEKSVFADKAYTSDERKREMRQQGIYFGILDKGRRNRPLSNRQKRLNRKKSKIRNAVERPFAHFKHLYGYRRTRYVKIDRNDLHFTFLCMIHNIRRGIALSVA